MKRIVDTDLALFHGEALAVLPTLEEWSVDAVVTSPPYGDARGDDYDYVPLDEHPAWTVRVARALEPLIRPGGSFMLNLGRRFRDGAESSYAERTLIALEDAGWRRIDTVIWEKPNALGRGGPYLTNVHETVYWLAPPEQDALSTYRGTDECRLPYSPETEPRYRRGMNTAAKNRGRDLRVRRSDPRGAKPRSVVSIPVGRTRDNEHDAPMALELADLLVRLSCPPGGVVLDPFCGSGTTCLAARRLGRSSIGIDVDADAYRIAARRLSQQSLLTELAT